jgi:hypothetical protein
VIAPNLNTVELCITYRCQNRCNNCSNLCTQAPATGDLSLDDIDNFIAESVTNNHQWKVITIHGGEPTKHENFIEICKKLIDYKNKNNPQCVVWVVSNGYGEETEELLIESANLGVANGISFKPGTNIDASRNPIWYVPVNDSPTDNGASSFLGCFQPKDCGVCRNYLGWYECSPAAAAARVFSYDPVSTTLKYFLDKMRDEKVVTKCYLSHCIHCGFSWSGRQREIKQVTSKTWADALERYIKNDIVTSYSNSYRARRNIPSS